MLALVPEGVWLLWRHPRRRAALAAVAAMLASGAALLPLAVTQLRTGHTGWIAEIPLGLRLRQLGEQFLAGFSRSPGPGRGVRRRRGGRGPRATAERRAALVAAVLGVSPIVLARCYWSAPGGTTSSPAT